MFDICLTILERWDTLFDVRKGILIADYSLVYPITYFVRNGLYEIYNLKKADVDRKEGEKVLHNFILGKGFQDLIIGSTALVKDMLQNLQKAKGKYTKNLESTGNQTSKMFEKYRESV